MIRRQEKLSAPDEEQDPHRLVVSRKVILRGTTPSFLVWLSTAALMSRKASLIKKVADPAGYEGRLSVHAKQGLASYVGPFLQARLPRRLRWAMGDHMHGSTQRNESVPA